jgi:flagellar hook-associated protein 1
MAGLTSALSLALSGLVATQSQTALVSRNITRAGEEDYTRKIVDISTDLSGNVRATNIVRQVEKGLVEAANAALSGREGQQIINESLSRLSEIVGDVEEDGSIAWGIGQLQSALKDFEASPSNTSLGNSVIRVAADLARTLNAAADIASDVRQDTESGISNSVRNANQLLSEIEDINSRITSGRSDSGTIAELLDKRDAAIKSLSAELGLRTVERPNRGIAIYTDSGVTLFDVVARSISFDTTVGLQAGSDGKAVYVDGVQVTGAGAPMSLRQGRIAAQAEFRDGTAKILQVQIDETARMLVTQFAESDQGVPTSLPAATGLFQWAGSPSVPSLGVLAPGIASQIKISPLFDPAQGGSANLLRDGGANGAAYVANANGVSGFQPRLANLISSFDAQVSFDAASGLPSPSSLKAFATRSAGWVEQYRSESSNSLLKSDAMFQRMTEALSKKSGVNIDEEMAELLNLEKSYQAAAKIMTTVDQMLATLMQIVR